MENSVTGLPPFRGLLDSTKAASARIAVVLSVGMLVSSASAEIFTNVLDPRAPSFASRTELDDTIVVSINAVRGQSSEYRRKAVKLKGNVPCVVKAKGAKAGVMRFLQNPSTSACVEYGGGMLHLRTRRAGTDSLVEWIPVRLSEAARSSIEQARLVSFDGSTLLELELRERSGAGEGILDDRSLILIDPVRERYLVNVMRSHQAEGGSDQGNFTESCEGVAQIRGEGIVLGGYACEEESEEESDNGEIHSYTRSTGPDPEFSYRYRNGFLYLDK